MCSVSSTSKRASQFSVDLDACEAISLPDIPMPKEARNQASDRAEHFAVDIGMPFMRARRKKTLRGVATTVQSKLNVTKRRGE